MDNIKIEFEIKGTNNIDISYLNTLVLQIDSLRKTMENGTIEPLDGKQEEYYNLQIESIIQTLENMKIKKPKREMEED